MTIAEKLAQELEKCSIACYMSISESFGVSAIEAMACECPVVASNADGFTEVIEDGVIVKVQNSKRNSTAKVRLKVMSEDIVRVSATPSRKFHDRNSLIICRINSCTINY